MFYFRELIYTAALYIHYEKYSKSIIPIAVNRRWYNHNGHLYTYRELFYRRLSRLSFPLYVEYFPVGNSKLKHILFDNDRNIARLDFTDLSRKPGIKFCLLSISITSNQYHECLVRMPRQTPGKFCRAYVG